MAGPRTSLFPTHTVANVGCASSALCTIDLPPRMNWSSGLAAWDVSTCWLGLADAMPGTATLFRAVVTDERFRRKHVVLVDDVPTRDCVRKLLIGGGHPGIVNDGKAYRVCIDRARSSAYDCLWVESLMPPD